MFVLGNNTAKQPSAVAGPALIRRPIAGRKAVPGIDLFVVGGSAGGLKALLELMRGLPPTLDAAVCVAIHSSPSSPGLLAEIVQRESLLPCAFARGGDAVEAGRVYCAPIDRHLLVDGDRLHLSLGPRENGFRPAIDPLFRTAAHSYGARAAGIILSGSLADGCYGLTSIKRAGGKAIIQDPAVAALPSMPLTALRSVEVDHVVAAEQMAPLVVQLAGRTMDESAFAAKKPPSGDDPTNQFVDLTSGTPPGELTALTCPECGGTLGENEEQGQLRFHCHVGHAYSAESLVQNHSQAVESAMWTALRVLNEHAELQERMKSRAEAQGLRAMADHFRSRVEESKQQVELLRKALFSRPADERAPCEDQSN